MLLLYGLPLFKLLHLWKGLGHEKDIFVWRHIKIIQYFLYMRKWLFKSALLTREINVRFWLLLWKCLLILKIVLNAASDFCSGFPSLSLVAFSSVHSWNNFLSYRRHSESQNKVLKTFTGRIFTISKWFHRRNRNFILDVLYCTTGHKNFLKSTTLIQKLLFWF